MYQDIINFINTYIKTNGQGEITGSRLNQALNMLANYYGFDGVTVTTLPAGSDATATVTNRTLNLGIPAGQNGRDGVDGRDATNPFKGWWPNLATLKAAYTATPGDYAYVFDPAPATTASIYVYDSSDTDNHWVDSGNDVDTLNVSSFMSGQPLNTVSIVDGLHDQSPDNVPSARQANVLGARTIASDAVEEQVVVDVDTMVDSGWIRNAWSGAVPPGGIEADGSYKHTTIALSPDTKYVRFNAYGFTSAMAYAFYDADGNCIFVKGYPGTSSAEYIEKVPHGAATFKVMSERSGYLDQSDFYCYEIKGDILSDKPIYGEDGQGQQTARAEDVAKAIAKLGGLQGIELTPLAFGMSVKGQWNTSLNGGAGGITTTGTSHASSYIDIDGYDAIVFLSRVLTSATDYGFAFMDSNDAVVDQYKYDVDASLLGNSLKTYYFERKSAWKKLFVKTNTSLPFFCYGITGDNVYKLIEEAVSPLKNLLTETVTKLDPLTSDKGKRAATGDGGYVELTTNLANSFTCKSFSVEGDKVYRVKGYYPSSVSIYLLYWVDADGLILRTDLKGTYGSPDTWDVLLTSPSSAATVYMNCYTNSMDTYEISYDEMTYINVEELKQQVEANTEEIERLESLFTIETKSMKVSFDDDMNIVIRTKLNEMNDIAITMYCQTNSYTGNEEPKNITFHSVYVGSSDLTDDQLMSSANLVKTMTDAIPPLTTNFGHIYAQHGWRVARFVTSHNLTDADLNTEWTDQNGKSYYIGKVEADAIVIIPKITIVGGVPTPSKNFWEGSNPTTLTEVGGQLRELVGTCQRFDLPVQEIMETKYIVDGQQQPAGTYYCDTFSVSQKLACKAPWGVANASDWFETPIPYGGNALTMLRSFNFVGSSCTVNTTLNFDGDMGVTRYFGVQPMLPAAITGYVSTSYLPKVKASDRDKGFVTATSGGSTDVYRKTNNPSLYDNGKVPERVITILSDADDNTQPDLVGFASGLSLNEGLLTPSEVVSLGQIPETENSSDTSVCLRISAGSDFGHSTKIYFHFFKALGNHSADGWNSEVVNENFVHNVTGYFTWFDPNINKGQQVYWIKENDYYVVYCHAQTLTGKTYIELPAFMEGMKVTEVIENTDGAVLLTDKVTCRKVVVKYSANSNGQANYLTFKIK